MQGIRDFLSNALGNGFEWIAWIALGLGILLIVVAFIRLQENIKILQNSFSHWCWGHFWF